MSLFSNVSVVLGFVPALSFLSQISAEVATACTSVTKLERERDASIESLSGYDQVELHCFLNAAGSLL